MAIEMACDPFKILIDSVNELYPEAVCTVRFVDWDTGWFSRKILKTPMGMTGFEAGCIPEVSVGVNMSLSDTIETFPH